MPVSGKWRNKWRVYLHSFVKIYSQKWWAFIIKVIVHNISYALKKFIVTVTVALWNSCSCKNIVKRAFQYSYEFVCIIYLNMFFFQNLVVVFLIVILYIYIWFFIKFFRSFEWCSSHSQGENVNWFFKNYLIFKKSRTAILQFMIKHYSLVNRSIGFSQRFFLAEPCGKRPKWVT